MDLKTFFETNNLKPTPWAVEHDISASVISRCLNGGGISLKNAAKIEIETNGQVRAIDLLKNEKSTAQSTFLSSLKIASS